MTTDADLLGLTEIDEHGAFRFTVTPPLCRMDDRLYGGTAIAVSVVAAELLTGRSTVWMTTQFVSTAIEGSAVELQAEVLAPGRRTNQVRVTATGPDGGTVFASLGATGHHRADGFSGGLERRPQVSDPDESASWATPFSGLTDLPGLEDLPEMPVGRGFTQLIEVRGATILDHPDPGPGRVCVWARRRDGHPMTPAMAAFAADMVPMAVAHGFGAFAGGTSLDNTIRFGPFDAGEWVLLDLRANGAVGDYGHGVAHVWSEDGRWMATASQTAAMRHIDLSSAPWAGGGEARPAGDQLP
jgi:acyl-CoA thioesterase-2